MRIAMVSEHASPLGEDADGQDVHVGSLARELGVRGHRVTVFTRRDSPELPGRVEVAAGVTVEEVPAGPPVPVPGDRLLPYMADFAGYLERRWTIERPDIAHAHFWMSGLAAFGGARRFNVPVVQTFHALGVVRRRHQEDWHGTSPDARIRLEHAISNSAAAVIATCSDEKRELLRLGLPANRIHVVPSGVDTRLFRKEGPADERRARYRLLCAGSLAVRKNIDVVIRALAGIPEAELVVAGGPPPDGLHLDRDIRRLQETAADAGVTDRVTFLGSVPHRDMPALVRSADLVVNVPSYEPFGLVPVEAMACGVPAVVTPVGGHLDTVVDNLTGIHVPARDPFRLARRVRGLLRRRRRRAAMGARAAERARSHYSWKRVGEDTLVAYENVRAARDQTPASVSGGNGSR